MSLPPPTALDRVGAQLFQKSLHSHTVYVPTLTQSRAEPGLLFRPEKLMG